MMTDPIADMLTRVRNAAKARKRTVVVPYSKVKAYIADILLAEGYVDKVEKETEASRPVLKISLKYHGKESAIQSLQRESKPGHRQYRKALEMPRVLNDYGIAIVSTSEGLMTNKEARKKGIGGEIICSVY